MTDLQIPTTRDLLWPTLEALKHSGGSASIKELLEHVTRDLDLADDVSEIPHGDGPQTKVAYRLAWARTYLKRIGAIENSTRGVWTIKPAGREIPSEETVRDLVNQELQHPKQASTPAPTGPSNGSEALAESDWEEGLLAILRELKPDAFERLCQRILRESGFTRVEVTGQTGDGGIDGAGVLRVNLISFHVRFQCKRYAGSVGAGEIRDFRGAMVGRADKGLFLTTGRFTRGAAQEAVRDGAPAIDLIDGSGLCRLLRKLELGVKTELVIKPQPEFFAGI